MWLDALQILLPTQVLAIDVPHVGDEEGILITGLASVFINILHVLLQSMANHLLGDGLSIVVELVLDRGSVMFNSADRRVDYWIRQRQSSIILEGGCDGRRCHYRADSSSGERSRFGKEEEEGEKMLLTES